MNEEDRKNCVHRNIHPGRIDGTVTVCLDCQKPIHVNAFAYANGITQDEQFKIILKRLETK